MADVVQFAAPPARALSPRYRKIRIASRALELVFGLVTLYFVGVLVAGLWTLFFYQGSAVALGPSGFLFGADPLPAGVRPFAAWSLEEKLAHAGAFLFRLAPRIAQFWLLRAIFGLYAQGEVFTARNTRLIKYVGVCLILDAVGPFACYVALHAAGLGIEQTWAQPGSLRQLLQGGIVYVIALVMEAGREIEEEREGFV